MPNPKSQHPKSKVIYRSVQRGSTSDSSSPPAFSAANASLENLSGAQHVTSTSAVLEVETTVTPAQPGGMEIWATAKAIETDAPDVEAADASEMELSVVPEAIVGESLAAPEAEVLAPEVDPVPPQEAPQFASAVKPIKVEEKSDARAPVQNVLPTQVLREAKGHHRAKSRGRVTWNTRPGVWMSAGLGAILLIAGGAAAGAYSNFAAGETIAPNVSIAGVPIGGLTPEAANARVLQHFGSPRIALLCGGATVEMPIEKLGAKLSIEPTVKKAYLIGRDGFLPNNLLRVYGTSGIGKNFMLPIEWNKAQLLKGLGEVNSKIVVQPVDARLRAAQVGLEVVPDHAGSELNTVAAVRLLQHKFHVGMPSIHLTTRVLEAKVSAHSLDGRDVQLAQYTTRFNSGLAGRTENIRIACRAIQNHVLMPGEIFSFNSCTGERTARKGYQMAHIFLRQPGEDEPEVVEGLAGGVCQVSSTLFNAIRKTNAEAPAKAIKVVERNTHSLPVTYVPPGLDATVAWPYKDLKFKNVTDHPVYVRTQMGRSKLAISIWSRVPLV